jgi:type IV pilus assembly protein PilA
MLNNSGNSDRVKGSGRGFSLIELLIVIAIILIIAAIAIPNMLRAKMAANEASGVSNLRTITTASLVYSSTYNNGYPPSLAVLGGSGTANCNGAILLDETLTIPPYLKSGYAYDYQPQGASLPVVPPGCAAPGYNGYLTTSVPMVFGSTGITSFCSDEPGTIHFDATGAKAATPVACETLSPLQ